MIEKFLKLENVGKFHAYKAAGDVLLRPFTLIFGDNGRGKTTLCAVLRSLQLNDAALIEERKTLGASDAPRVELLVSGAKKILSKGKWDSAFENIAVFDSDFVHANVVAGEFVDHKHKRNLHRVIVGEVGVKLAGKIDSCDEQSRDIAKAFA